MNLMEFRLELEKLDMPIQYQSFSVGQAPDLPYLIFYEDDSDNLFADNVNYFNNYRSASALGYKSPVQYKTELGFG